MTHINDHGHVVMDVTRADGSHEDITMYERGDEVTANGYPGTVMSEYMPGMYEVRLPGGVVVLPWQEIHDR